MSATDSLQAKLDSIDADFRYVPSEDVLLHPKFDAGKLSGLGPFKIGSDESVVDDLKNSYQQKTIYSTSDQTNFNIDHVLSNTKYLLTIKPPHSTFDELDRIQEATWCSEAHVYCLNKFKVDGITLENVYLTYYKSKLVSVKTDWTQELMDAIVSKYGEATSSERAPDLKYYAKWWDNKDIRAGYSSTELAFQVQVKGSDKYLAKCSSDHYTQLKETEKREKKSNLKNL
jgi:hypothetical protein